MAGRLGVIDARDRRERKGCAFATVREVFARGERVTWIVSSRDVALAVRRRLADTGRGMPGVEVATLADWAQGRWTLYGDGRTPLSGLQRRILAKKVLDQGNWESPSLTSAGMVECLAGVAQAGAGLPVFEEGPSPEQLGGLSAAQRELVQACRAYLGLVREHGLIEQGSAMHALAASMPPAGWPHLVLDGCFELEGAALELVGAACAHSSVTLVGCLGANAAFESQREVARRVEGEARGAGARVEHASGAEYLVGRCGASASEPAGRRPYARGAGVADGRPHAGETSALGAMGGQPQSPELKALADALFNEGGEAGQGDSPKAPKVEPTGAVRACLPAGRYAEGTLLARQIAQLVERDGIAARDIALVCRDPLAMARKLAGPLSEHAPRGISLAVSAAERASHSHAGAFALGWARLLDAAAADPHAPAPQLRALACDLARNPYMRISQADAFRLDRTWRAARLTGAADFVDALCELLEGQQGGEGARTAHKDLAWTLALLQARLPQGPGPDDAFERACAAGLARACKQWRELMGGQPGADELAWLLDTLSAPAGWTSVPTSDIAAQRQARALQASPNAVRAVTPRDLDALVARAMVLCDLTADDYPLRERVDARRALWQALGLPDSPGQVAELRRRFRTALEAASDVVVVERTLADAEAKPLRPCALLEELVDCYRDDPCDLGGLNRSTGLPADGSIPCMTLGEEEFSQLAGTVTYAPALLASGPAAFELADPALGALLADPQAAWSPSSLEALVNCPMRWLHERRLPSDGLDVPFDDPRSRGTFCHLVLERFHKLLEERSGLARIVPDTPRALWEGAFDESFRAACDEQMRAERPLVPICELERARLRAIRRELASCIKREASMPEGFVPQGAEVTFGYDRPIVVGGVPVHGVIDRIDVNKERGALLVVDYKGTLDAGHGPAQLKRGQSEDTPLDPLPRHSQILMYMAAARQLRPDLALAGGLYVSYKKPACSGFVDPALVGFIGDERDAYLQRKRCVPQAGPDGTPGMEVALASVEATVKLAVDELREGRVVARPRFGKDSCLYCPLAPTCPGKAM